MRQSPADGAATDDGSASSGETGCPSSAVGCVSSEVSVVEFPAGGAEDE